MKESRLAWWEWKKAGAPSERFDPYVQEMRKAKKNIRKEQRLEAARQRKLKALSVDSTQFNLRKR